MPNADTDGPVAATKRSRRHPLFGCMKDVTFIAAGVDLTEPACPEWADIAEESCAELARMLDEAEAKRKL